MGAILYEMVAGAAPDQEQINQRSMYITNSLIQQPNADLNLARLINKALSYNTEYRYATAGEFLQELRSIAPPVLLVNRKHLRFGEVAGGRLAPPMTEEAMLCNSQPWPVVAMPMPMRDATSTPTTEASRADTM